MSFLAFDVALVIIYSLVPPSLAHVRSGLGLTYFVGMVTTLTYAAKAIIEDF